MKNKKWIFIILAIIIAVISTYFIIKTYGATGIANTKNEETLVRMVAAKAMAQNSDRSVTRDQVASIMGNYVSSSSITVTDYTEKVTVKYNSTGNTYTIWKGKTYTVAYNANGGSGAPSSQVKLKGTNLTLSSTKPTRTNYTFQGWGTSASDTSVDYAAGATYSTDKSLTLYAIWKLAVSPATAMILNYSDTVSSVTGGYNIGNIGGYAYHQGWRDSENAWVMRYSGNNWWGVGWMQTVNKINITGYTKLRLTGSSYRGYGDATKGDGYVYIALVSTASGTGENATGCCTTGPDGTTKPSGYQTPVKYIEKKYSDSTISLDLDITGITGSYYIQIGRRNASAYATFSSLFQTLTFIQ